ncbi:hypothetical protein [Arthrobacter castelli]|uniref:hypothetical protein n=1 Tax=Arthrobacter castelli TaxID=271431 RepID=UPI000414C12E|nr:hypothetical protein [Arthrobacter castelli]
MNAARGTQPAASDVERQQAALHANSLALLVAGAAALLSLLGSLIMAAAGAGWIASAPYILISSATPPLFALAFWWMVSRWEVSRSIREHRGAAALLVAIAVLVTVFSWSIAGFSPFYAVFLFLVGVRTKSGALLGYALLAALVTFATGALPLPLAAAAYVVFAAACAFSAWRLGVPRIGGK